MSEPGKLFVTSPVTLTVDQLRDLFRSAPPAAEIRNPHLENRVASEVRDQATPSAVLVLVTQENHPRVLLTKRQQGIRFGGHMCFPGGRANPGEDIVTTALRESQEEIGLEPEAVEVLGSYGHYFTQAGYRIDPVVGLVAADYPYTPDAGEVASIHYASLQDMLDPAAYQLRSMMANRSYFGFELPDARIGGPTVSLMIGFLEWAANLTGKDQVG